MILDLDTPGGEANGAFETAQAVREVAARKPVIADRQRHGGVRRLCAGVRRDPNSSPRPPAMTGSIGVALLHLDLLAPARSTRA